MWDCFITIYYSSQCIVMYTACCKCVVALRVKTQQNLKKTQNLIDFWGEILCFLKCLWKWSVTYNPNISSKAVLGHRRNHLHIVLRCICRWRFNLKNTVYGFIITICICCIHETNLVPMTVRYVSVCYKNIEKQKSEITFNLSVK